MSALTEWTLDGVLDEMAGLDEMTDRQFAFILGAGASFTSGIPTGHQLAQRWLEEIHKRECRDGSQLQHWLDSAHRGFGASNISHADAGAHYPIIFERRFHGDREAGYAALERVMEGKSPSLGYSLLAEIIQNTRHKVVITTNFDNLVAESLAMHGHQSPLVVAHESLTGFVRPQMRRPLVAKIHRDLFLNPINDASGVSNLEKSWKEALRKIFRYFTPVVIGYGGNDGSLMDMLNELDEGDIVGRMIWCYRDNATLPKKVTDALEKHKGVLVKIPGFDEFMLQLAEKIIPDFGVIAIPNRLENLGQKRATQYREQIQKLQHQLKHSDSVDDKTSEALSKSVERGDSWWAWELKARDELNIHKRDKIYADGLKQFPDSIRLLESYANFLADELRDFERAETMYKNILERDSGNLSALKCYAIFLMNQYRNNEAEQVFKNALVLDGSNANLMASYATFLAYNRNDINAADTFFKKALELDPMHINRILRYAVFLSEKKQDYTTAETFLNRALSLEPDNVKVIGYYADFLKEKNPADAEATYKKALELAPKNARNLTRYANFLSEWRKDFDAAEVLYKQAVAADKLDGFVTRSYADFLCFNRRNYGAAEIMYEKTFELDPKNPEAIANYAWIKMIMGSRDAALAVTNLARRLIGSAGVEVTQAVGETLLYGALAYELFPDVGDATMLPRLKGLLAKKFERLDWHFENLFAAVFGQLSPVQQNLYRALGAAILDENEIEKLDQFHEWQKLLALDPFAPL